MSRFTQVNESCKRHAGSAMRCTSNGCVARPTGALHGTNHKKPTIKGGMWHTWKSHVIHIIDSCHIHAPSGRRSTPSTTRIMGHSALARRRQLISSISSSWIACDQYWSNCWIIWVTNYIGNELCIWVSNYVISSQSMYLQLITHRGYTTLQAAVGL